MWPCAPHPHGCWDPPGWRLLLEWVPSEEALWGPVFGRQEMGPRESEMVVEGNAGSPGALTLLGKSPLSVLTA